jgi:hypothetical protein
MAAHQKENRYSRKQNKGRADNGPMLKVNLHSSPLIIQMAAMRIWSHTR